VLAGVTTGNGTTVDYTTDGEGLRRSRTSGGTTTRYTWTNGDMPLLLDDGGHRYLYGPNLTPYAQIDTNGIIQYLHTDDLGSVRLITDTTGTVVGTNSYNPYGGRVSHTGADSNIGFTGAWTDAATGLIYLRARDYDPATAQFLSIDPAIDTIGQPYAYADNNPLQNTDPTGLCTDCGYWQQAGESFTAYLFGVADTFTFGGFSAVMDAADPYYSCFTNENKEAYAIGNVVGGIVDIAGGVKLAATGVRAARQAMTTRRAAAAATAIVDGAEAGGAVARTGTALVRVGDFANEARAFEHYSKHVKGVIVKPKGKFKLKKNGADVPEFATQAEYRAAARRFMQEDAPSNVISQFRGTDLLRVDPQTGYFGIRAKDGTVRTFFRPDGDPVAYFWEEVASRNE
jgi:RHS repeat-associated protein